MKEILDKVKAAIKNVNWKEKKNIDELEDLYKLLIDNGIKHWRVVNCDPIGRALDNQNILFEHLFLSVITEKNSNIQTILAKFNFNINNAREILTKPCTSSFQTPSPNVRPSILSLAAWIIYFIPFSLFSFLKDSKLFIFET